MTSAYLSEGWLRVPYTGHDLQRVAIAAGSREPGAFEPAYLHWDNGQRVAQVRPANFAITGPATVWLSVDGTITEAGRVDL